MVFSGLAGANLGEIDPQSKFSSRCELTFWKSRVSYRNMTLALREENFVVIDVGSYITKAGIGANDTNKPPSVVRNNLQ